MMKADIIVLGGGPGGYLAAERAGAAGKKVVLIEKNALGGTCLNEGCIPSKALLNSAKIFQHAKEGAVFGVLTEDIKLDTEQVINHKNQVVNALVSGVCAMMDANGVHVVSEFGYVEGKTEEGFVVKAGAETYSADTLILASGSVPVIPPIPGLKEGVADGTVWTNREALDATKLPEKLVVIGGGVIGLEMASYYAMSGVNVTIVEMMDKIAGPMEREVSDILLRAYRRKGVKFKLGCKVTGVTPEGVLYEKNGEEKLEEADQILCAIGRRPYTENMGLENLGLEMNRSAVVTDDHLRTNVDGVYAVGDINGKVMLAHTAYREAEVAVNNILGKEDRMDYSTIPSVIYTDPEVAGVGESEESAEKKGMKVRSVSLSMNYSGRYLAEVQQGDGICKLIVNEEDNTVVGVHMIGSYASEIILAAELMITSHKTVPELQKLVFPHPTVGEIIRETLFL
ncbi:dihydrolipoyl dehydrogenase [Ruminococcus sp. CLA-AA-H200]|uniref:Dihydrolipoyl dehydrogenase n=1 Tax=Ruminococcus turbiniformis TaxID=2881258 RepID=A0ABS8FY13_9FIRM|nr:dihydrolipoyl dehydrogenase [Ruminococcus turbiniformis]MCC2254479.1 dihydrolipoyl dehydrogenase [Ruminococcus turbiniformis]